MTKRAGVPKPSTGLKSVHWARLPAERAGPGTVWASVAEADVYKLLDIADIEAKFATGLPRHHVSHSPVGVG